MSDYIVSARKYRPATFESVVGQKALTETLRNAIRQNHLAHAYLFCGPRGVGKTTCARIFAKTINCLNPTADHDACNQCESCTAFNEQRSFNIHELDAASNNSVEDIRTLIQEVRIPPQIGKYSVYIIDEVHMLSQGAFNALLKTLEEPPSYAVFILATTEKHKVPATILSRCQVYDFQRITLMDIVHHLEYVAQSEGIQAEQEALRVVAEKADGGMRDALSIFDQLVAFCGNTVTYAQTIEVLNVLNTEYYFRLTAAAVQNQHTEALLILNEVLNKGFDAGSFIVGLMQHLRNVLVAKDTQTLELLETSETVAKQYADQAAQCGAIWLFRSLDLINTLDINYRTAKNKRLTVELALVKWCTMAIVNAAKAPDATPTPSVAAKPAVKTPVTQPQPAAPVQGKHSLPSLKIPSVTPTTPAAEAASPAEEVHQTPFTSDRLNQVWAGLKQLFPKEERLQLMLSEYQPVIGDDYSLTVTLINPWQKEEFAKFSPQIMEFVQRELDNNQIRLHLEVAEYTPTDVAYTAQEKYKVLLNQNPRLKDIKDALKLQID
ncbi:MAG: DNA polymerase III subunit gamma/tau [Paludibacteraceae bacterium]|nr:DNA polymerase III subunit gamma/tau [Paludibacteraceae bacterium]